MSGQAFGVALNPQNLVPIDINISTSIYTTIVPPYQNISSGTYQVMINTLSDTYFQTRDRGVVITSNFSYSTVAVSLLGTSNNSFIYQNMRDYNYFPLVSRTSPFNTSMNAVAWNGSVWVAAGIGSNNIATSTDGLAWVPRDSPLTSASLFGSSGAFGVTWNFTMSNWVVVGSNGSAQNSNVVAISRDNGVTWSGVPGFVMLGGAGTTAFRPAYAPSLSLFLTSSSNNNSIVTSSNPIGPYTFRGNNSTSLTIYPVWNGTMFLSPDIGNAGRIVFSFDGINWTAASLSNTNSIARSAAWSPTLGLWVVSTSNNTAGTAGILQYSYNPTQANWISAVSGATSGSSFQEVIWTGTQFVAVGTSASSYGCWSSTTGITFTSRAASIFTTVANGVAWSPTLGLYVAVGQDTTNNIATSTNLTSWTGRTGLTIFSTRGNSVAWSPTLNMFVAVGSGTNTIAYSYDGINWVGLGATFLTFTSEGFSVVWFPEFLLFVATGSGTNSLLTSPDGINWTPRTTTGVDTVGRGIDWSSVQNQYVMVGSGSHNIATSSDGIIWVGRTGQSIFSSQANAVMWVPALSIWVALGQGTNTIATSPDGLAWTGRGATIFTTAGFCIDWNGTTFVAGGQGTNTIATSTDGITWVGRGATAITTAVRGVAWSAALGLWIVTGNGTNAFATSTDNGVTWTGRTGTTFFSTQGETIDWSPQLNMFVAGGSGTNTLVTSSDGLVFAGTTLLHAFGLSTMFSIAWNGTVWVAGGVAGTNTIITSPDGINWTARGTPVTSIVYGIAWNGSLWVAVGSGTNRVATSADAITWISRGAVAHTTNRGVIWYAYKSCWIAVGDTASAIFTSPDGITWTSRATQTSTTSFCIASNTSGLLVLGCSGTNRLQTSPDGITWTARTSPAGSQWNGVAYSPDINMWVIVGTGTNRLAYSFDAINWTGLGATVFSSLGSGVTWNGNYFIATGTGTNNIATSADGINWRGNIQRQAFATVLCVANRSPLMVAGGTGTNTICTSDDNGLSWRPRFTTGTQINCVAWNGYTWVAGSSTGPIYTSPDGITWTTRTSPFTTSTRGVVWADQLKLWVMVGSGTFSIATSPDGVTWTGRHPVSGGIFNTCMAIEWNGNTLLALGTSSVSFTSAISVNGIVWTGTSSTITGSTVSMGLAWNGNVWVAISGAATNIWSSPNGNTWTSRSTLLAGNTRVVRWNGSVFVVFGSSTDYQISRDGFTWISGTGTIPFSGTTRVTDAAWNSAYGHWVITGVDTGTNVISIATTRDLVTFTPRMTYPPMTTAVQGFAWASQLGLWVGVGSTSSTIISSPDGTTWTSRSTTFSPGARGVAWNGTLFVAVGGTNTQFFTSTDGINWTDRQQGGAAIASFTIFSVVWASSLSLWVAVGQNSTATQGVMLSSTNGTAWTIRNSIIFTIGAFGVAWNGSLFVAVGSGTNVFATSTDGLTWAARGATGITTAARGIVWATAPGVTSQWVAVGNGTNSIATSTDGVTWVGRTTTTIFSTQGNQVANNGFATVATGQGTNSYAYSYDNGTTWTGGGGSAFGTTGLGIAWNSNTGQWVGGASNAPFFLSSADGINWISRQNFTTSAQCIAMENRPEKTFVINNAHWTGRTSQQTFRILS